MERRITDTYPTDACRTLQPLFYHYAAAPVMVVNSENSISSTDDDFTC